MISGVHIVYEKLIENNKTCRILNSDRRNEKNVSTLVLKKIVPGLEFHRLKGTFQVQLDE